MDGAEEREKEREERKGFVFRGEAFQFRARGNKEQANGPTLHGQVGVGMMKGFSKAHSFSLSRSLSSRVFIRPPPPPLHFPPFKHSPHCLTGGLVHLVCFLFQTFQSSSPFNCNPSSLTSSPHLLCFTTMLVFHKSTTSSWTDCLLTLQQQNKKSSLALVTAVIAQKSKKEKGVASPSTLKRIGDK